MQRLSRLRDEAYAAFQRRLLPTVQAEKIIGVRTPALRVLTKEMQRSGEAAAFLQKLPHDCFEENQLHAFLIADIADFDEALRQVERFLPYVNNWATCDQLRPKAFADAAEKLLAPIKSWIASPRPYTVRFGLEMLMCHFMGPRFDARYLDWAAQVHTDDYYVKMMLAWFFATALTKQYDAAVPYLEQHVLPQWVHEKTIQKAVESRCIPDARKAYLRSLK